MAQSLATMTAQLVTPPRYGKRKRAAQIGVSATTFLALSIWIGPTALASRPFPY